MTPTVQHHLLALAEGNHRFASGATRQADVTPATRRRLACRQEAIAAVLASSDSRIVPELIFDQGLGRLFVVRIAGASMDETVIRSLEYAVYYMELPLILVMGQSDCETHRGTCDSEAEGSAEAPDPADADGRENVRLQLAALSTNSLFRRAVDRGRLDIVGAWYDQRTGLVTWL